MAKVICVYASSSDALEAVYIEAAVQLGELLAQRGHTLIYGGGGIGLMGAVARGVHNCGGKVIGVIPEKLVPQGYNGADEMIITPTMRERKAVMEEKADAFISLPGGFGTMEEVLEVLTLKQLGYHAKPIVLLNTARFYDPLDAIFEHFYAQRFARTDYRGLYHFAPDVSTALDYVDSYRAQSLPQKWLDERA